MNVIKKPQKILAILSICSLILVGCFEICVKNVESDLNNQEKNLENWNKEIDLFVRYDSNLNNVISIRDMLIVMDQSTDFNLSELINIRGDEIHQSQLKLIYLLEEMNNITPQSNIKPLKEYSQFELQGYKNYLISVNENRAKVILDNIGNLKNEKNNKENFRNLFFFLALIFQLLSETTKRD